MVSHEVTFLTRPSLARLQERLESLRPRLTQSMREVHEAAAYGDLTENFEWEAAKHQRELLKAEIVKIEAQLANYQLIEELQVGGEKVTIGTKVTLEDVGSGEAVTYSILGSEDVDIPRNIISHTSPIARQLLMRTEGEAVQIRVPSGLRECEIVQIEKVFP